MALMTLEDINKLLFPFYKFGNKDHAIALNTNGVVRIASLYEFRDDKYTGSIVDETEGLIEITGSTLDSKGIEEFTAFLKEKYKSKNWIVKDTNTKKENNSISYSIEMEVCDLNIFCSSIKLISETLIESLENGYTHATMIIDKHEFFQAISKKINIPFIGAWECNYNGVVLREKNDEMSHTLNFLEQPYKIALQKPSEYSRQSEVRAIWYKPDIDVKPSIKVIPKKFRSKLIDLTGIDLSHFRDVDNNGIYLEIRFKMKSENDKYVEIYRPFEMFHIGVKDDEFIVVNTSKDTICRDIIHLDVNGTSWGFYFTGIKINDVKLIEISTKQDETDYLVSTHITSASR